MSNRVRDLAISLVAVAITISACTSSKPFATAETPSPSPSQRALPTPKYSPLQQASLNPPHSILGLYPALDKEATEASRLSLTSDGYKVTAISDRELRGEVDGLNAEGLGSTGFEVVDPKDNVSVLTVFLEKDGSIGLITSERSGLPLMRGGEVALHPGEKLEDVRAKLGTSIKQDSEWMLVCETPDGWMSLKFMKNALYGFTLTSSKRGPKT
jgi:hypothetical protein